MAYNPFTILKKGVRMFKPKVVKADTGVQPEVPVAILKKTPGGKMFKKRKSDLERALNDEY